MNEDTKTPETFTENVNPEVPTPTDNQPSPEPAGADSGRDNNPYNLPNVNPDGSKKLGRISKYQPALIEKAREYLTAYKSLPDKEVIPTIEGLCLYINVNRSNVYNWLKDEGKEEFQDIVSELMERQAQLTINGAMVNQLNASISKLLLSKHGYVEKSETDLTTKGEKITTDNQTAANEAIMKYLNGNSGNNTNERSPEDTTAVPVPGNGN